MVHSDHTLAAETRSFPQQRTQLPHLIDFDVSLPPIQNDKIGEESRTDTQTCGTCQARFRLQRAGFLCVRAVEQCGPPQSQPHPLVQFSAFHMQQLRRPVRQRRQA